jgi:hypothetical protein
LRPKRYETSRDNTRRRLQQLATIEVPINASRSRRRRAVLVKAGHLRAMTFKGGRTLIEVASVRELMRNDITSRPNS